MGRILTEEDEVRRPHLIEYDRNNPSPKFSDELIQLIETIQDGFSESELALIRDYEYFIFNIYFPNELICRQIPGIRPNKNFEVVYIMRFNNDDYRSMMNRFLEHIPADAPSDLTAHCNMPGERLTIPDGSKFYPINYHYDLAAWRRQISESAKLHNTKTGRFENGKFVLSDGQTINFSDLVITGLTGQVPYPADW